MTSSRPAISRLRRIKITRSAIMMLCVRIRAPVYVPASWHYGFSTSCTIFTDTPKGKDPALSQGHVIDPYQAHPQDPQSQSSRAGFEADPSSPYDAAGSRQNSKAPSDASGNKDGVGFAEQVGSA